MRYPALVPAACLLAGVAMGCFVPAPASVCVALIGALWVASVACLAARRSWLVLITAGTGFCAVGWLLGMDADRRAQHSTLRVFFDREIAPLGMRAGPVVLRGVLRQDAQLSDNGVGMHIVVERVSIDGRTVAAFGGAHLGVNGTNTARAGEWRAGRRLTVPAALRRPLPYLNPGVADQEILSARRGTVLLGSVKSGALIEDLATGTWFSERCAAVRVLVRTAVAQGVGRWDTTSAAVTTAILIGDRAGLGRDVEARLQAAGTYHVIAISGGNIAILAGLMLWLLRAARVSARLAAAATIAGLSAYAALVGAAPSVLRATLVASVYLAARLGDHHAPPLNALGVAAAVALCAAPLSIFDAGFALSFGATIGILLVASPIAQGLTRSLGRAAAMGHHAIERAAQRTAVLAARGASPAAVGGRIARLGATQDLHHGLLVPALRVPVPDLDRWCRWPAVLFGATLAAELVLLPLAAFAFSRVSFAGLLLNFFAIPLMSLVQIAGMATVGCWMVSIPIAGAVGYLAHIGAAGLVRTSDFVDVAPWLALRLPPPDWEVIGIYFCTLAGALAARRARLRRSLWGCTALAAVWVLLALPLTMKGVVAPARVRLPKLEDEGLLRVMFLDVGQGDAAVARFPDGRSMLIDTGGGGAFDVGTRVVAPVLWHLGIRRLDYLALTHGDPDHVGGALAVLRDFRPRELWEGVAVPGHEPMRLVRADAEGRGVDWRARVAGDTLRIGSVQVEILNPPIPDWERRKVRNDDSLVIEVRIGSVGILLTGDIGRDVERALLPRLRPGLSRIVKVPHHGSASSSSPAFVDALHPAIAVVSAGRANWYGHPRPEVLERYQRAGTVIFRTDQDGAVEVVTNGREIAVGTMRGRKLP